MVATLLLIACGDNGPVSPTPPGPLTAPTLSSPADDAVVPAQPSLIVNNVAAQVAARTYDFQVADSLAALTGPLDGLFASATGVAEGTNGRTSYDLARDLQVGRRYYWRSRVTQAGVAGPWSSSFRFRTAFVANAPPVIQAITASSRTEPNTDVEVSAVVQDQEASAAGLVYEWTATGGTFTGTGASVRWQVQGVSGATAYDLTLTVIERYTVALEGGGDEARENRISAKTTVHVNDSRPEITILASTFIDDFLHSDRSPEFCIRNFSDNCQGKQDELRDIRENRARFINDPARSSLGPASIDFFDTSHVAQRRPVPPAQASFAEFLAPCRFASTTKATGQFGFATGICRLTTVYENWQWRLCDSNFLPPAGANAFSLSFPF